MSTLPVQPKGRCCHFLLVWVCAWGCVWASIASCPKHSFGFIQNEVSDDRVSDDRDSDDQDSDDQDSESASNQATATDGQFGDKLLKVQLGFDGNWCVGRWTPVRIQHDCPEARVVEMDTLDGDGVPIRYRFEIQSEWPDRFDVGAVSLRAGEIETVTRVGRMNSSLTVSLRSSAGDLLASRRIKFENAGEILPPLPSTTLFSLCLGTESALTDFVDSSQLGYRSRISIKLESAEQLPVFWRGLDSAAHMVIATRNLDTKNWHPLALRSSKRWLQTGGNLLLSCGTQGSTWFAAAGNGRRAGWIADVFPGRFAASQDGALTNSTQLEKFVANDPDVLLQRRAEPLGISHVDLDYDSGDVVEGESILIAQRSIGLGTATFVMFDLDDPRIESWNVYSQLMAKLVALSSGWQRGQEFSTKSENQRLGFTDISGQLRSPLDQFDGVGLVSFTAVALLVVAFILVVGPGEYFILRHVFGRMQWTWLTFPVWVALFCGLGFWIFGLTKPPERRLNHVELLDIDTDTGLARGVIWSQAYSPETNQHLVSLPQENELCGTIRESECTWLGLAGKGLGGMQSLGRSSLFQSRYLNTLGETGLEMDQVPLQVTSSKTFFATYQADLSERYRFRDALKYDSRTGRLSGTCTNPLDFQLKDCALFFRNSVIELDEYVEPKSVVGVTSGRVTTFDKFVRKDRSRNEGGLIWNKRDTDIPRILTMISFFKATNYTGLTSDVHESLDLSQLLNTNEAILVGRIDTAATPLRVDGTSTPEQLDTQLTMVRIVFPVDEVKRN